MNSVKIQRKQLLEKLISNRDNHRALFLKAQEGYRKKVIEELDRMLAEARDGSCIRRAIELPEPEDHTEDYDTQITMLEMSVDDVVQLSAHEFSTYVMDNWSWKANVVTTSALYVS